MTRVIIACAGGPGKWGNYLGVPRHLAPMDGEPLLHRTVRQLLAYPVDIHVTAPEPERYLIPGTSLHVVTRPAPNEYVSSRHLWCRDGRTVLLLGDVYFTDDAIATILGYDGPLWRLFGRAGPSAVTGSPWGEVFGSSWLPRHHAMLDEHLQQVALAFAYGHSRRFTAWEVLRSVQRTPLNQHMVNPTWFGEIDDATDDLDTPADFDRHPAATRGRPLAAHLTVTAEAEVIKGGRR
jgi:hypothetical protein